MNRPKSIEKQKSDTYIFDQLVKYLGYRRPLRTTYVDCKEIDIIKSWIDTYNFEELKDLADTFSFGTIDRLRETHEGVAIYLFIVFSNNPHIFPIFTAPLDEMPLYINDIGFSTATLAKWRLRHGI